MEVFRLCRSQYCQTFDGKGAALYGARWNSPGVEVIYTAANRSLAMAEIVVHISLAMLPDNYYMVKILIPDDLIISEINLENLPIGWNSFPHIASTRKIGDKFVKENSSCILKVPSAVTNGDYNYLINPLHSDFEKINVTLIEKFPFDRRIFKL